MIKHSLISISRVKTNKKHFLLVVICSLVFVQAKSQVTTNKTDEKGKKQGLWIKLDDDKKKLYEGNFVDNIPVGKFIYYYDDGKPWSVSIFSNNGTVTHSQMFDAAGKVVGEGKYINQKKDSIWKYYDHKGNLISDENYINGIRNGVSRVYYPNGQLVEEKHWKGGQLDGSCKKYFNTGQIRYEGQHINGKVEGNVKFYYPNGKVNAEGLYVNDLKDGSWKYYKQDGTPDRTDKYINGRLQGDDPNIIPREQEEKEKKQYEQEEIVDPYGDENMPRR